MTENSRVIEFEDIWLNPRELYRRTSIAEQTLANDRHLGRGFPYVKRGRMVLYHWPTVAKILHAATVRPRI